MLLLLSALLAAPLPALAPVPQADSVKTVNGVNLPLTVNVGGQTLHLNGAALRKKAIFKVYVAALYVATKSNDASAILAEDAPRRMEMHFLRDVDKKKICDAWADGLKDNTPDASAEVKQQFTRLCDLMDDIKDDQAFVFTYVPGEGTTISVAGNAKGKIGDKAFSDAMLRTWIGPKPGPGDGFKKNLLGKS
ncbi:MAG TPA: chalcone isomerase family protein [Gemmatimonadales bacterium]|nr:chalcone isomerase family protein [Gemmatimonadales bacterium]